MDNILNDIFVVSKTGEVTISLYSKTTDSTSTLDYFMFRNLLFQSFDVETIDKILDRINCMEKLIIDFKNCKVKRIIDKDMPFHKVMLKEFQKAKVPNLAFTEFTLDEWNNF